MFSEIIGRPSTFDNVLFQKCLTRTMRVARTAFFTFWTYVTFDTTFVTKFGERYWALVFTIWDDGFLSFFFLSFVGLVNIFTLESTIFIVLWCSQALELALFFRYYVNHFTKRHCCTKFSFLMKNFYLLIHDLLMAGKCFNAYYWLWRRFSWK